MARPVVNVYMDLAGDGGFATNVTSYLVAASWQLGFTAPFEAMARDSTATVMLVNTDRRFSPEYSIGPYYGTLTTGKAIKITTTYLTVTRTMFIGWMQSFIPASGVNGSRQCEVDCNGWTQRAELAESVIPLQLEKRADEVITTILENSAVYPAGFAGFWFLGSGLLGQTTKLGSTSSYLIADEGQTTFAYSGDWAAGTSVYAAILEMAQREAGRVFISRDGLIYFYDRHHLISNQTSLSTLANQTVSLAYSYGSDIANYITVQYEPRVTGTAGSTLATLSDAVKLEPNVETLVSFRFTAAASGATVSAATVITPVINTDYTANTIDDGTGIDTTSYVTLTVQQTSASEITIAFTSTYTDNVFLLATTKVRGTPLTSYGMQTYVSQDETSILTYGKRALQLSGKQDSLQDATTLGDFQKLLRYNPVGKLSSALFNALDTNNTVAVLARTIGDRVTITDTMTSATGDWFIIGEQHNVSVSSYTADWLLEDAGASAYWSIGSSTLGISTALAPL